MFLAEEKKQTFSEDLISVGFYGRIASHSGLALKDRIDVEGGEIDSDFREKVSIIVFNYSKKPYEVELGDRIAQIILKKVENSKFVYVDELPSTKRGSDRFSSSGI